MTLSSRLKQGLFGAVTGLALTLGCASGPAPRPLSEAALRLDTEAQAFAPIQFEEDFLDARLVFQGLPETAPARAQLRARLLAYLIDPLAQIDSNTVRQNSTDIGANDDADRVLESLRDALDLFSPHELAAIDKRTTDRERAQLMLAARKTLELFGPQGTELPVAMSLFVLATLDPKPEPWMTQLGEMLGWVDAARSPAGAQGPKTPPSTVDVLESVVSSWPAPLVVGRLGGAYLDRQTRLATLLRRPLGSPPLRGGAAADLLAEGDAVQNTAPSLASIYMRAADLPGAAAALQQIAGRPGDDPELRQLVTAAAASGASRDALVALARRFLPRIELLGGTSNDRLDPVAAHRVLEIAVQKFPGDGDLLLLASRVARLLPAPFLALRYMEEATAAREKAGAGADELAGLNVERLDVGFVRLRRFIDPDHIDQASKEAERMRAEITDLRRRFGTDRIKLHAEQIDLTLARGLADAGRPTQAETLYRRALPEGPMDPEIALQLATLATKRGDATTAIRIIEKALEEHRQSAPEQKTVGYVELDGKLAHALGNAHEVGGTMDAARNAWKLATRAFDILALEHLRRRNTAATAEAMGELARLYHKLGRPEDALQKLQEALEQSDDRSSSYIDSISFLVQRGDVDGALQIYRRALGRPSRVVPEEHKVYTSLWILDLSRRAGREPDASAEGFLRAIDTRPSRLRPSRASKWYRLLARFALGGISYVDLLAKAHTIGEKAEANFYQAMRELGEGRTDQAHTLWRKVVESQMVSFFEYEMSSRYLRSGAPTEPAVAGDAETI